jgi:hypothetical protein
LSVDNNLPDEIDTLLKELKKDSEKYNGTTPSLNDSDFWNKVIALVNAIRELGLEMGNKEIADYLGFSYGPFNTMLYKAMKKYNPRNPQVSFEKSGSKKEENKEPENEEENNEQVKEITSESPLLPRTQAKVIAGISKHMSIKAENVVKEETEKLIKIGTTFRDNFEHLCYQYGFNTSEDCMFAMAEALFDEMPKYEQLKEDYEVLQKLFRYHIKKMAELYNNIDAANKILDSYITSILIDNEEPEQSL